MICKGASRIAAWVGILAATVANAQGPARSTNPAAPAPKASTRQPAALPRANAPQPPEMGLDSSIDVLLRNWSDKTKEIKTLYAEFRRTTDDKTWQSKIMVEGRAEYLHPGRARLDIDPNGDHAESYILTGKGEIWEIKPPHKQIKIYRMSEEMQKQQQAVQDGPLPLLMGTEPEKAKARYELKIEDETEQIVHLSVRPKLQRDQQDFVRAEIWLDKKSYLPHKLLFVEPNNNVVTFEFTGIWTKDFELDPNRYEPKRVQGYRVVVQELADRPEREIGGVPR